MKHLFIPYELAVIVKGKGFNEPCFLYFGDKTLNSILNKYRYSTDIFDEDELKEEGLIVLAPTHQQVIDWLRLKYNIVITINPNWMNHKEIDGWEVSVDSIELIKENPSLYICIHNDYYEGINDAIDKVLKLI